MSAPSWPPPRDLQQSSLRLEHLYGIVRALLAPYKSVEAMVGTVLGLLATAVPLRSVILVEKSGSRTRLFAWRASSEDAARLESLRRNAAASYSYLTGLSAADLESREAVLPGGAEAGAEVEPVVIPLALRDQPSFGVLQVEAARALDEDGLAFVNTAANHIAIALDLFHGRRRETALRRQAERAEAEVRRVNESLERRIVERTSRLEQTIRDLHVFSYSIAHDLRAPLRHIHGYTEFVIQRADAESQAHARRIMDAVRRMDTLIEDLLQYGRLTLDEFPPETVDPSAVLSGVLSDLAPEIRDTKARVDVETPLPPVQAHAVALAQIFTNLISNALKFTPSGVPPRVRVRSEAREGAVRLIVEDDGIGIDPAHQGRIFDVFQRLHKAPEYPGTGIGLAIVRRAAERMGGSVGVESSAGKGSRFWVELRKAE